MTIDGWWLPAHNGGGARTLAPVKRQFQTIVLLWCGLCRETPPRPGRRPSSELAILDRKPAVRNQMRGAACVDEPEAELPDVALAGH